MKKRQHLKRTNKLYSLLMLLTLTWLTICLPYAAESNQFVKNQIQLTDRGTPDSDKSNPLNDTNEEKSESGLLLLSEYLPHSVVLEHVLTGITRFYKYRPSDLYLGYHPKLIIPPPEA